GDDLPQIFPYIQELRLKIAKGESLYYTWNLDGGVNYYYLFVYVLINPMSYILVLMPEEYYALAINIGLYLTSILMHWAMYIYLSKREYGLRLANNQIYILIFSLSYALIPAVLNAASFYPFMSAYIFLPLTIIGLERIVKGTGFKSYYFSLIMMFISNFYIAMIECIFVLLYYFTLEFDSYKRFVIKGIKILILSLMAIATCAFIIIPVSYTILGGVRGFSDIPRFEIMTNWINVLSEVLIFKAPVLTGNVDSTWEANLYSGTFIIMIALAYFFISRISIDIRVRKLILFMILMLSFNNHFLNYVFHFFHTPYGLPNRHTILFLFYIITLASEVFSYFILKIKKKDLIALAFAGFLIILIDLVSMLFLTTTIKEKIPYIVTFSLVLIYIVVLIMSKSKQYKSKMLFLLAALSIVEISCNFYSMFGVNMARYKDFYSIYENADSVMDIVRKDDSFFRSSFNDVGHIFEPGMAFGNKSVCGYSNAANLSYLKNLQQLGVHGAIGNCKEVGYTPFINAIITRKYIVESESNVVANEKCLTLDYDNLFSQYELITKKNGYNLYRNPMVINPIMISENEEDIYADSAKSSKDASSNNNALCKMLTNVDDIMRSEDMDVEIAESENCLAVYEDSILYASKDTMSYLGYEYDSQKESSIIIKLTAKTPGDYYLNGDKLNHLGYLDKGESTYISYSLPQNSFGKAGMASLSLTTSVFDDQKFAESYLVMSENEMDIESYTDSSITGTINSKGDHLVFTTIPYDKGWNIYIDDEKVKAESISGAFLTFHVSDGEHKVYMEYHVRGLMPGVVISLLFIILGVTMMLYYRNSKKCIWIDEVENKL
ncbi:MAG: YfhO family protein, partial [Lachnospiraceae bacterium]|nr:YfhO family protein [Lachnospiraceae bacterium]